MIAVSSSTQEEEQVFPFFMVLSACLNLEDVNSADVAGEKQGREFAAGANGGGGAATVAAAVAVDRRGQDVWCMRFESRDGANCVSRK